MTQNYYPQDPQNLLNSEGVILEKLLHFKTTLGHLESGLELTPTDLNICAESLREISLIYQGKLYAVGFDTMN